MNTISAEGVAACWALFGLGLMFMMAGIPVFDWSKRWGMVTIGVSLGLWTVIVVRILPVVFS